MGAVLGQYCINVTDIERSIEFWEGVIGIPLVRRTEIPGVHEAVLQAPAGGSRMQLAQHLDHTGPVDMGSAMWKLYVITDDCQALYDKAVAAGAEEVTPPMWLDEFHVTMAYIRDLDGYLVEFVQYEGDTPPGVPDPRDAEVT